MTDINKVILVGRLTQDCGADEKSFQYVGNGIAKAVVSIAVNRSVKKNNQWVDEVSFFNITIWGKTAQNLKPFLIKGTQICVCGFLSQDRWVDDNNNKKSRVSITAETVQLCGNRNNGGNGGNGGYNQNNGYDNGYDNNGYQQNDFPEDVPYNG